MAEKIALSIENSDRVPRGNQTVDAELARAYRTLKAKPSQETVTVKANNGRTSEDKFLAAASELFEAFD